MPAILVAAHNYAELAVSSPSMIAETIARPHCTYPEGWQGWVARKIAEMTYIVLGGALNFISLSLSLGWYTHQWWSSTPVLTGLNQRSLTLLWWPSPKQTGNRGKQRGQDCTRMWNGWKSNQRFILITSITPYSPHHRAGCVEQLCACNVASHWQKKTVVLW